MIKTNGLTFEGFCGSDFSSQVFKLMVVQKLVKRDRKAQQVR
jgi:hypothetical protein